MQQNKNYEIIKTHICSLEKRDGITSFDLNKYPERICILDKTKNIVIDIETKHQYTYLETMSMLYVLNSELLYKIKPGNRVAVVSYAWIPGFELTTEQLNKCEKIINSLKQGKEYPEGNKVLTNEEYLEMVTKREEKNKKVYKFSKKRK